MSFIVKTLINPFLLGSVYSVVAVALERYFNICKPFNRNLVSILENDNLKSLGIWYITHFSLSNSKVLDGAFECGQNICLHLCKNMVSGWWIMMENCNELWWKGFWLEPIYKNLQTFPSIIWPVNLISAGRYLKILQVYDILKWYQYDLNGNLGIWKPFMKNVMRKSCGKLYFLLQCSANLVDLAFWFAYNPVHFQIYYSNVFLENRYIQHFKFFDKNQYRFLQIHQKGQISPA